MNFALQIKNLNKSYGTTHAVQDVSFNIEPAEIFALLGPNGAGKTSTIACITTLEQPTSGQIQIFDFDLKTQTMQAKRMIGVVHQEVINSGFFDVEEILKFQSGYYGLRNNHEQIQYLLHKLSLFEHRHKKVKQLSGGMKRRLMIAKALVHKPKLLILDEPTAGVDVELRESLWVFVKELQSQGISILLTTHYLEEAQRLCRRVGIINKGRLDHIEDTAKLVAQYGNLEEAFKKLTRSNSTKGLL
ncbi:MAG: ABC transporter ATP-binding protein [Pseudobdellovibrionaceae bacterium]